MNKLFVMTKNQILSIANPHFYTGRSVVLLSLQQLLRFALFLKTERPPKRVIREMAKLANQGKGRTALVLGNGPSLDKLIPEQATSHFQDIFVVNGFHNLRISEQLAPSFYCLSDPLDESEIDNQQSEEGNNLRKYLQQNLGCTRLLPHTWSSKIDSAQNKTMYFDDRERTLFSRNIKPIKPRAYSSVTLYKALAIACYMGYEQIFILGFDNTEFYNYVGRLDNKIGLEEVTYATLKNQRKYSSGSFALPFVSGMSGRMQSYAHLFGDLLLFSEYPILNLDPKSLTDVFPKIENHPAIKTLD